MNILYLIGNGLDVALGMKTKYSQFYDYYCNLPEDKKNTKVCALKDEIETNRENWADLELAFGRYTVQLSDQEDFESVYYNLSDELVKYLRKQEEALAIAELDPHAFLTDLSSPDSRLAPPDQRQIPVSSPSEVDRISIISFNYTRTIERILELENNPSLGGKMRGGSSWKFDKIYHVHGTLDDTILLGLNDAKQIENKEFANNQDIKDILVKPQSNAVIKSDVDRHCRELISNAKIIVLFGLSIGETDQMWWREIGKHISIARDRKVIIYHFDPNLSVGPNRAQRKGAIERKVRSRFLKMAGLDIPEDQMHDQIFVGVNTDMFGKVKLTI